MTAVTYDAPRRPEPGEAIEYWDRDEKVWVRAVVVEVVGGFLKGRASWPDGRWRFDFNARLCDHFTTWRYAPWPL